MNCLFKRAQLCPFPSKKDALTVNLTNVLDSLVKYITTSINVPKVLSEANKPTNRRQTRGVHSLTSTVTEIMSQKLQYIR